MTRKVTIVTLRGHRFIAEFDGRMTVAQAARAAALCCGYHPDGLYLFALGKVVLHRDDVVRKLRDGDVLTVVDMGGSV